MTDQPGQNPRNLPVPRPEPVSSSVERFTAPPSAHARDLSPERAAKIVRQSSSARWVAFLAVTILAVFVAVYFFYETGVPGVAGSARLEKEITAQQVTDVARGYTLYQTNCARCHGVQGEGGLGPKLNDQAKLLTHLTPGYIQNVLTVGGRLVCGDAKSLMPVWSDQGNPPGPLNYRNLEEIITFLRAPNTLKFTVQVADPNDPKKTVTTTMTGWRDPAYALPAGATAPPACWKDAYGGGATAAPASPGPSATPAGSGGPEPTPVPSAGGEAATLELRVATVKYFKDVEASSLDPALLLR
jgi:mono/diheme cytochrome c family protein